MPFNPRFEYDDDEGDFQNRLQAIIGELGNRGYRVKPRSRRTAEEQARIYRKGRFGDTGPIRTELSGEPGRESLHQLGTAADLDFFDEEGKLVTSGEYPGFKEAGKLGEEWGLEWGGRWKKERPDDVGPDPAHLQLADLRRLRKTMGPRETGNLGAASPTARVEQRLEEPETESLFTRGMRSLVGEPPPGRVPMSFGDAITPRRQRGDINLPPEPRMPYGPFEDEPPPTYGGRDINLQPPNESQFDLDPRYSDALPAFHRPRMPDRNTNDTRFDLNPPPMEFGAARRRDSNINLPPMPEQNLDDIELPQPKLAALDDNLFRDPDRQIRESRDIQPIPGTRGAPRYWVVTNPRTGEKYNWLHDTPPTPEQAEDFIYEKLNQSMWQKFEAPLTERASLAMRGLTSGEMKVDPRMPYAWALQGIQDASQPQGDETSNLVRGTAETIGDITSALTSPSSIVSAAASGGTLGAARMGLGATARGFNWLERGLGAAQFGHGGYRAGRGAMEGDMGQVGAGALEMGFGALGMMSRTPEIKTPRPITPLGPRIEDGLVPYRGGPNDDIGDIVEGEIIHPGADTFQPPPPDRRALPPIGGTSEAPPSPGLWQRSEPPTRPTYYAGKYGTGTNLNEVAETYQPPPIPPIETPPAPPSVRGRPAMKNPTTGLSRVSDQDLDFMARSGDKAAALEIRNRAKVAAAARRDALLAETDEITTGGLTPKAPTRPTLEDIGAEPSLVSRLREALNKGTKERAKASTGLEKMDDTDVELFAKQGDPIAIREARSRPSLWARIKGDETGAVGPGTAARMKVNKIQKQIRDLEDEAERRASAGLDSAAQYRAIDMRRKQLREAETAIAQRNPPKPGDNPVVAKFRAGLDEAQDWPNTRFILPDGMRLTHHSSIHEAATNALGMKLTTAMDNGVIRYAGRGAAEVSAPITQQQAEWLEMMAYESPYAQGVIDLRSGRNKTSFDFDRGTSADKLRTRINNFFKETPPDEREFLKARGLRGVDSMTDAQVKREADRYFERDFSPNFEEDKSLLQRLKEWNEKKGEGGFIKIGGRRKTGPGRISKVFQPAKGTKYEKDFAAWVNEAKASNVEGVLKGREFQDLKEKGQGALKDFIQGSRSGRLADVQKYLTSKIAKMHVAGLKMTRENANLDDIWNNTHDEIETAYKKMGKQDKQSYSMGRIMQDLNDGIKAGLDPKFENLPHFIQWFETKANRAIANKKHITNFVQKGWLRPEQQSPPNWKSVDQYIRAGKGRLSADPEFQNLIKNYLGEESGTAKFLGDVGSFAKNMALSAGIPGTAINSHGMNIFVRTALKNPVQAFKQGKYFINPKTFAKPDLDAILHTAPQAVRDGLTLTTEGYNFGESGGSSNIAKAIFGEKAGGAAEKFTKFTGNLFEDPLFQNVIPTIKLKHFNEIKTDFIKGGMSKESAGPAAAEFVNNLYGGINWEAMGRSRDLQNLNRAFILAPDWAETNVRLGKETAGALKPKNWSDKQKQKYLKSGAVLIGSYAAASVANLASSGHLMHENAPGHTLDIDLGESNGKKRWFRPFGTAADFVRLPVDVGLAATKEDLGQASQIIKNRFSIPFATSVDLATKRNRFGRPILGRDDYGRPIPLGRQAGSLLEEISGTITPPYVKSGIDLAEGDIGLEESILGGIEMPFRYSSRPKPQATGERRRRPSR